MGSSLGWFCSPLRSELPVLAADDVFLPGACHLGEWDKDYFPSFPWVLCWTQSLAAALELHFTCCLERLAFVCRSNSKPTATSTVEGLQIAWSTGSHVSSDMYLGCGWGELTGPWTDSIQRSSEKSEGAFRQAGTHTYYSCLPHAAANWASLWNSKRTHFSKPASCA